MPAWYTEHDRFNLGCAETCRDSWAITAMFCTSDGGNGGGKGAMYPDQFYGPWQSGVDNFHPKGATQ